MHHDATIRTTVDIPESLLRRARARAALEGRKLKDIVNDALVSLLGDECRSLPGQTESRLPKNAEMRESGRFRLPVIRSKTPGAADITPEMLKDADSREDEERHAALTRR